MQYQDASDESLPRSGLGDGSAVTPLFPALPCLGGRGSLGWRDLTKELPQFEPGALVCRQEGNPSLFRVVAHEDGNEQRQDENSAEQVEDDEVDRVAL